MSTDVTTYMLCDERMSSGLAMPPGSTEKPALQKDDMEWNVAKTILSSRAIGRESGMEKHGHGAGGFHRHGEPEHIEQGGDEGVHALGVDHVAEQKLVVDRRVAGEEHGEETRERDNAEAAELHQHGNHGYAHRCECRRDVDRRKTRDAHGAGRHKQRVEIGYASECAFGKHEHKRADDDENQKRRGQDERRLVRRSVRRESV